MAQFNIGLNATIVGQNELNRFRRTVQSLGQDIEVLHQETAEFAHGQEEIFRIGVKGYEKLTRSQRQLIQNTIAGFNRSGNAVRKFGASFDEINPSLDDVTKHLNNQAKATAKAAQQAQNYANVLARLQQRQSMVTQAQQQRLAQSTAARDINRQADSAEFDRRRNARLLDDQARHNRQMQAAQARHTMAMQRINAYGSGGAGPGAGIVANLGGASIAKVLAYDALRRSLTNIYQLMGKIGDEVGQWVIESIKFNDEMRRAETVMTGLGLLGLKNAQGTSMSISEAEQSRDPKVQKALSESQAFSKEMMDKMLGVAIMTGQDSAEIVASARQLITDLLNKKSNVLGPGKNALLENPKELAHVTEAMVKLGTVLKMADPGGRKLGFHMVAVQELFSGTSGGKKDTGLANVRSMMMREGIKIREADALPIAQAVNKGELNKAAELIKIVMEKAGMSDVAAKNLQEKTLMPNIDGVTMSLKALTSAYTDDLTSSLIETFKEYRIRFAGLLDNKDFMAKIRASGRNFTRAFDPFFTQISRSVDSFMNNPDKFMAGMNVISNSVKDSVTIFTDLGMGLLKFAGAFMGLADGKNLDLSSIKEFAAQMNSLAVSAGIQTRDLFQKILNGMGPITTSALPATLAFLDTLNKIGVTLSVLNDDLGIIEKISYAWNYFITTLADEFLFIREMVNGMGFKGGIFSNDSILEDRNALKEYSENTLGYSAVFGGEEIEKKTATVNSSTKMEALQTAIDRINRENNALKPRIPNEAIMKPGSPGTIAPIPGWRSIVGGLTYGGSESTRRIAPIPTSGSNSSSGSSSWHKTAIKEIFPNDTLSKASPMIAKHIETGLTKKPIVIQPSTIRSDTVVHIGTMTVQADDPQKIFDMFKSFNRAPTIKGVGQKGYPLVNADSYKSSR